MSGKRIIEGLEQAAAHARAASQAQDALSEEGLRQLIWQTGEQFDMTEVLQRPEEQARVRRALAELAVLRARQGAVAGNRFGPISAARALLLQMGQAIEAGAVEAPDPEHRPVLAAWCEKAEQVRALLSRPTPSELPGVEEIAGDERQRAWVADSLRAQIKKCRAHAKRCRQSYAKDYMVALGNYLADAYDDAALAFERAVARLAKTGGAEVMKEADVRKVLERFGAKLGDSRSYGPASLQSAAAEIARVQAEEAAGLRVALRRIAVARDTSRPSGFTASAEIARQALAAQAGDRGEGWK